MQKKLIICVLIISLLSLLQSCCTMIGYNIGKSIDEKSKPEVCTLSTDSSKFFSDVSHADSSNKSASNYKTLFTVVGVAADISLAFMFFLLTHPIQINMGNGF